MPRIVAVSNRVSHGATGQPAGGLAVAIAAALEETGGMWFGWSGETTDTPPATPQIDSSGPFTIATVDLSTDDFTGYYEGEANRTLWPLLHGRLDLAHFSRQNYFHYRGVNRRFAKALAQLLKPDDLIWVHDFHLIPLGLELRRLGVRSSIGFFLHVPFPPTQTMDALPWLDDMLEALQAYDLVGFQTKRDLRNFRDIFKRYNQISTPAADTFPIGVHAKAFSDLVDSQSVARLLSKLHSTYDDCAFAISVDRLDYTKGLIERFEAFNLLLERHPALRGRVSLMQIAAPSRESITEYQAIREEVESIVGHINGPIRTVDWTPLHYINRNFTHTRLVALYRFAKVGLVTPLCDGMNLVCKEYVIAQDKADPGVLVLSKFAGAAEQMTEALLVNPYDREGTSETIERAFSMPLAERIYRWKSLVQKVRLHDIHAWRRAFVAALSARSGGQGAHQEAQAIASCGAQTIGPVIDLEKIDVVLLDLDGVLTDTAALHAAAWKETFDAFLKARVGRKGPKFEPFDSDQEYRNYVDGKPRLDGVKAFLAARRIDLPEGSEGDTAGAASVHGLSKAKNQLFLKKLKMKGVAVKSGVRTFLQRARQKKLKLAVVTASRNGSAVIDAAGIGSFIDILVDGNMAAQAGLAGKPAPDTFIEAAHRLGATPERAAVIEDATAGVCAGRRGGFGLVIGIGKPERHTALIEAGADITANGLGSIGFVDEKPAPCHRRPASVCFVPDALANLEEIRDRIGQRPMAIFLDYDGTLTPIVERPELAVLDERMRTAVANLARHATVCIISGRALSNIQDLVKLEDVIYAGAHGYDICGGIGNHIQHAMGREFIEKVRHATEALRMELADIPGVLVEDKKYTVAIHYRLVDPDFVPDVSKAVNAVLAKSRGLCRTEGKKVFELRPDIDWNKGKAVLWILEALDREGGDFLPFCIGDDVTDEDAFKALKGTGLSFFVGDVSVVTQADYRLADPDEVRSFLCELAEYLETRRR
jgi:alpha,alpha-trehalose-phosphate synthase [UDP-forming]/trehalose-phosphatase